MRETLARIEALIAAGGYGQHMAINTAKLVTLRDDARMREIVERCDFVNADGQGVVWASRLLGTPLPERVAGIDLMEELLRARPQRGYRVYILGAREDVLDQAVDQIREHHPGISSPAGETATSRPRRRTRCAPQIRATAAAHRLRRDELAAQGVFPGRARPRQLGAEFVMGVGGAVDVMAGLTRRAPATWQRLGLEWLFRLLQEPRRMFRRYAVTNARFALMLASALATRRRV